MRRGTSQKVAKFGQIRVISGQWRGRKLSVMDAQGLRPTTDRTKETLFNWLTPYISGSRCLDLFAGTGSLGIEALSRYAESCDFCELNHQAARILTQNLAQLTLDKNQYSVTQGDAFAVLPTLQKQYDIIFIDPPFNQALINQSIELIHENTLLSDTGLLYIESESNAKIDNMPESWQCIKQNHTKNLRYQLYQNSHD